MTFGAQLGNLDSKINVHRISKKKELENRES
jgi:hypothetical protein